MTRRTNGHLDRYASFIANILLFYIDREEGNFPQEYSVYSKIIIDQILLFQQWNTNILGEILVSLMSPGWNENYSTSWPKAPINFFVIHTWQVAWSLKEAKRGGGGGCCPLRKRRKTNCFTKECTSMALLFHYENAGVIS